MTLTKNQKRRLRKKRTLEKHRGCSENAAPLESPPPPDPKMTIRFATPDDQATLAALYRGYFQGIEFDFSDPAPYFLLLLRDDEAIGALQLMYSKPVAVIENLILTDTGHEDRARSIDLLFQAGFGILGNHGAECIFGFVNEGQENWLEYVKKRGWVETHKGIMMRHEAVTL